MSDSQRTWLAAQLRGVPYAAPRGITSQMRATLHQPLVWPLGGSYAFAFSAPARLKAATQWDTVNVGACRAATGLIGAAAACLLAAVIVLPLRR